MRDAPDSAESVAEPTLTREERLALRRAKQAAKLRKAVEGKRYRLSRICTCVADGWGCCCTRPITVIEDPDGDYVLTYVLEQSDGGGA